MNYFQPDVSFSATPAYLGAVDHRFPEMLEKVETGVGVQEAETDAKSDGPFNATILHSGDL